jgi:hypothetical protein
MAPMYHRDRGRKREITTRQGSENFGQNDTPSLDFGTD